MTSQTAEFFPEKDLLGDPLLSNIGRRGRPRHMTTARNIRKFNQLRDAGWSRRQIAEALGISEPTLRRRYFPADQKRAGGGARPGAGRPRGSKSRSRPAIVAITDAEQAQ